MKWWPVVLLVAGCGLNSMSAQFALSPQERQAKVGQLSGRPEAIRTAFLQGRIIPGMTGDEVVQMTAPNAAQSRQWEITRSAYANRVVETWRPVNGAWLGDPKGQVVCELTFKDGLVFAVHECSR